MLDPLIHRSLLAITSRGSTQRPKALYHGASVGCRSLQFGEMVFAARTDQINQDTSSLAEPGKLFFGNVIVARIVRFHIGELEILEGVPVLLQFAGPRADEVRNNLFGRA